MRKVLVTLILFLGCRAAMSSGSIIQITRALRMSNSEALAPKNFYVDVGTRDGAREGDVVQVYRFLPVTNVLAGAPYQLLRVVLGELKLISVGEAASLARVHSQREAIDLPAMESTGFMLGDHVQVTSKSNLPFQ